MADIVRGTPFARAPEFNKRNLWQLGLATALATGVIAAASVAQARITQITISTRGTAFGGYSFPGVGQYEVHHRHCVRRGQPEQSAKRGDHRHPTCAEKRERQCRLSAQFLHPEAPRPQQGQSQDDVRAAKPRRQDLSDAQPARPSAATIRRRSPTPPSSRIHSSGRAATRRYGAAGKTTSGRLTGLTATAVLPVADGSNGATITGPGLRIHRHRARLITRSTYPAASRQPGVAGRSTHAPRPS